MVNKILISTVILTSTFLATAVQSESAAEAPVPKAPIPTVTTIQTTTTTAPPATTTTTPPFTLDLKPLAKWLEGYKPKAPKRHKPHSTSTSSPQATVTKPKTTVGAIYADTSSWSAAANCVMNHENAARVVNRWFGNGISLVYDGKHTASGLFQIVKKTWGNYKDYLYAALAPAQVQYERFQQLWAQWPPHWHGTGCPGT